MSPEDARHGKNAGYIAGCREACCKAAHAAYRRKLYARQYIARGPMTIPAIGTQRRIQALQAIGWRITDIADALGLATTRGVCAPLWQLMKRDHVRRSTAERIANLYDRWCMTPGPAANRNRAMAVRRGWAPPLAWNDIDDPDELPRGLRATRPRKTDVDPVAVERSLAGRLAASELTHAERLEVVGRARRMGWSFLQIEARTGITKPERYTERMEVAS